MQPHILILIMKRLKKCHLNTPHTRKGVAHAFNNEKKNREENPSN